MKKILTALLVISLAFGVVVITPEKPVAVPMADPGDGVGG